jgi:type IV secretion system protein TrbB
VCAFGCSSGFFRGLELAYMSKAQQEANQRITDKLKREFGPALCALFSDQAVIEIMLNSDGKLWVERLGQDMEEIGTMGAAQAELLMGTLAYVNGVAMTNDTPSLSCELPKEFAGARFQGHLPPVVKAPSFTIRKKAIAVFTLSQYVERGIMTQAQREVIEDAVRTKKNILIAGGTGSGKTTLTNAVVQHISEVCSEDRIIILEDLGELKCSARNAEIMLSSAEYTMTRLLKDTLRMRPDRILVGEVRDGAALDLLMAWNTGHPGGVCTLHSDSALLALSRLEQMIALVSVGSMKQTIAEAVGLVVFIEKCAGSRRVKEIIRVLGFDGQSYKTEQIGGLNV